MTHSTLHLVHNVLVLALGGAGIAAAIACFLRAGRARHVCRLVYGPGSAHALIAGKRCRDAAFRMVLCVVWTAALVSSVSDDLDIPWPVGTAAAMTLAGATGLSLWALWTFRHLGVRIGLDSATRGSLASRVA